LWTQPDMEIEDPAENTYKFPAAPELMADIVSHNDTLSNRNPAGQELDQERTGNTYFKDSPPSVTLIPLRKLNGNAGNPGAGS
jgi:hypothetical protein